MQKPPGDSQSSVVSTMAVHHLINDNAKSRPIPRPYAYPSRFGLANAVSQLVFEYGRIDAINILIEMAELLEREEDPLADAVRRRRLVPSVYTNAS